MFVDFTKGKLVGDFFALLLNRVNTVHPTISRSKWTQFDAETFVPQTCSLSSTNVE